MKLFGRLFAAHAGTIVLASAALIVLSELFAARFIAHHVEEMVRLLGPQGEALRPDLERGMRSTLTLTLLSALPLSLGLAALTAALAARRIVRRVQALQAGSRALSQGDHRVRLDAAGGDELADLAASFNTLGGALGRVEADRIELIGNVAHELRTPLSALRGYAEALTDGVLPAGQVAGGVEREVAALERLVRDLSLVSRVEAGQIELHPEVLTLGEVYQDLLERFGATFEARGVNFALEGDARWSLQADPLRLSQILSNLLSNALRHTPLGGEVRVRATVVGGTVQLAVQDTGRGIPLEQQGRVFERFVRLNAARVRGEGSGIGLTVARGLARAMGGDLTLHSVSGMGSTFTLYLPQKEAHP